MRILLDSNVFLRAFEPAHPHFRASVESRELLRSQGHELLVVPQVLYEFWVVATRPKENNGLAMLPEEADKEIASILRFFRFRHDNRGIFGRWRELVVSLPVRGKQAHDARLAASMQQHAITHLLTFNVADFARYSFVTAISPGAILAGQVIL